MRAAVKPDLLLLGAGLVAALLGLAVLLDSLGALAVSMGWVAVGLTALVGAILLISGLARNPPAGQD